MIVDGVGKRQLSDASLPQHNPRESAQMEFMKQLHLKPSLRCVRAKQTDRLRRLHFRIKNCEEVLALECL